MSDTLTAVSRDWADHWQTPSAQQFEAADLDRLLQRQAEAKAKGTNGNGFGLPLANEVQIWTRDWATPKAITGGANSKRKERGAGGPDLQEMVKNWPTPTASDDERKATQASHQRMLAHVARDFPSLPPDPATPVGPTSSPERRTLNPLFVEWLMGWPIGWTASAPVETASSHWWLAMRGELSRLVSPPTPRQPAMF
ncbi:hypothetical protein [Sphingomonas sp. CCH9-E2]|uniref:hypothetical protein n=1 Tax=Sphingomonas sp. CCH9-E2 TaxID=1768776 RepID=UPI00082AAA34|nr:hypothetical protein [Sphingomonas sp. CCH9-E2]